MSSVDKRIVDMQFNNGEFEKNIATSLKSLDDLKKGLVFDKSIKKVDDLQKAANRFSLENMAHNVQQLSDRFSAMGIAGMATIQRMTNAAITAGKHLVTSFTIDPVKAGLREYETQISAIQTILSNTRSKGSTLTNVNEALDELNRYADKTIYNFTEMAKNIGTFTAAGVELKTSTEAIKGIANLAAVSGSNAQQASVAMYQLSQALSSGTVRLMDWNSVVNAGMGGEVFQNALKETARLHDINIDAMIKKEGSFRESLQNGWLTSTILTETLQKFTGDLTKDQLISLGYTEAQADGIVALGKDASDAATKVKTFTQLIDTLKEALGSGWAQTWENVIGNFEEARDLWTSVSDALGSVITQSSQQRNDLLADWKEQGGRDDLLKGLQFTFEALWGVVLAVGDAMESIFPPATVETLLNFSKGVKSLGQNLRSLLYYSTEYTTSFDPITKLLHGNDGPSVGLKKGDKGEEVKELQRQLTEAGFTLEQDGIFGKKTADALKRFQKDRGLIVDGIFDAETKKNLLEKLGITSQDGTVIEKIANTVTYFGERLDALKRIASGGFAVFSIGLKIFKFLGDVLFTVGDALSPLLDLVLGVAAALGDWLTGLDRGLTKAEPFTSWIEKLRDFLAPVKSALKTASDAILKFFDFGPKVESAADKMQSFADVLKIVKEFLFGTSGDTMGFTSAKQGLVQKIGEFLGGIADWYSKTEMAQYVAQKLQEIITFIKDLLFGSEGDGMGFTSGKPNIIQRIGEFFNGIAEWYGKSDIAQKFTQKVKDIVETIKAFLFGTEGDAMGFSSGEPNLLKRLGDFFQSISDWYQQSEIAQTVVDKLKEIVQTIKEFLFGTDGDTMGFTSGKPSIIERVGAFFDGIIEWYSKSETAKAFVDQLKTIVQTIRDFIFGTDSDSGTSGQPNIIQRIGEFFTSIATWYAESDIAQKIVDKVKQLIETIKVILFGTQGDTMGFTSGQPGLIQKVGDFLKKIADWYAQSEVAQKVVSTIKSVFSSIVEAILSFFSVDAKAEAKDPTGKVDAIMDPMAKAGERLTALWDKIVEIFGGVFQGVGDLLNFFGPAGLVAVVAAAFGAISIYRLLGSLRGLFGAFTLIAEPVKGMFGSVGDMFGSAKKLLDDYGKKLKQPKKALQPIALSILEFAAAIAILVAAVYVLGSMNDEQLKRGGLALAGLVGVIVIFTIMAKIMDKANAQKSFGTAGKALLNLAFAIGILAGVIFLLGLMDPKIVEAGANRLIGIMFLLTVFMVVMKQFGSTNINYKGLIAMSIAVGIMGLIAWALGGMDPGRVQNGIIALGGLMFILGVFMAFVNRYGGTSEVKYKGLFGLSMALAVMVGIVAILGGMDQTKLWPAIGALGAIMAMLGGFMIAVNRWGKGGKVKYGGLIALSIAISLLVGSVMVLGGMNQEAMARGVAAVVVLMGAMAGLMLAISSMSKNINGKAIAETVVVVIGLGALMYVFGHVLTMIKDIDPALIATFAGSLIIALGGLIGIIVFLEKQKMGVGKMAKGAAAVGVAVATFVGIVTALIATMGWIDKATNQGLTSALESGGKVLRGLGQAIGLFVAGIREGILGINDLDSTSVQLETKNASLTALADAINGLKSTLIVLGLALVMSMFVAAIPGGTAAIIKGAAALAAAVTILVAAASIVVGGLGAIDLATDGKFSEAILKGADVMYGLGMAVGKFVAGIKNGFNTPPDYSTSIQNLEDYATALQRVSSAIEIISEIPNVDMKAGRAILVTQIIKRFFDSLKLYPMNSDAFVGYATAPGQLATDMASFGVAIATFTAHISNLGNPITLLIETVKALGIAAIVYNFFKGLKGYAVYKGLVAGYYTAPSELASDMANFATAIGAFAANVAIVGAQKSIKDNTDTAIEVAKKVKVFFDSIGGQTINPLGLMFYNSVASSFLTHMQTFGTTAASYGAVLKSISETTIKEDSASAISVAEKIRDFLSELTTINMDPYRNAIGNFFLGKSNSESFMDQMVILGDNLRSVSTNFKDLGTSTIVRDADAATTAAKTIATFLAFLSSDDFKLNGYGSQGTDILPTFAEFAIQMNSLGQAIVSFGETTKTVDLSRFTTISWGIGAIGKALSSISATSESESFKSFKEAFDTVKEMLTGTGADGTKLDPSGLVAALDTKKIDDAFITFMDSVAVTMDNSTSSIQDYVTGFNAAGSELASSLNAGVSGVTDTSGVSTMVGGLLTAANNFKGQFKTVGWNLGMGLREGLIKSTALAVAAAEYVAKAMLAKLNEVFNINSPSREGISIGKSVDEGLAIGASKFAYVASKSAEGVGTSMLDATRDALSGISDVIDSGMEGDPVIRPVLDLSNISSGARTIGGMFSGRQTVAVDSLQSKALASSIRMPGNSATINQNSTAAVASSAVPGGSKFDFTNSQFIFKDKMDVRAWKLELAALDRDDDRAHGSVH